MEDGLSFVARTLHGTLTRRYSEAEERKRLERAIENETYRPQNSKINRIRHRGSLLLHTKVVLLIIVLLNLIDCALVLGELILDIHYIKGLVEDMDEASQSFIDKMERQYPQYLQGNTIDNMEHLYDQISQAKCAFNSSNDTPLSDNFDFYLSSSTTTFPSSTNSFMHRIFKRDTSLAQSGNGGQENIADNDNNARHHVASSGHSLPHAHSVTEDIAHGLHKASVAILGVLFLENVLKIFFMGKKFFQHKLEVFDAIIVTASFVLDLVFIRGLTVYRIQDGILILSFIMPWRVIRVVNSLIVAVLDNEHFRLKMMYKRQKTVTADLKDAKHLIKDLQLHLKKIERFCINEGIPQWKVDQHIHFYRNASAISSMASYALGSMLTGILTDNCSTHTQKESKTNGHVFKTQISARSFESRRDSGRGSIQDEQEQYQNKTDSDITSTSTTSPVERLPNIDVEMGNIDKDTDNKNNHDSTHTRM